MSDTSSRKLHIDLLRVIACLGVIAVHTTSTYSRFCSGCVTLFFVLSGASWLTKDVIDIKVLWNKYIKRLVIAFLFWSLIYDVYQFIILPILSKQQIDYKFVVTGLVKGPFHFWFLWVLLGIYLAMPILQRIAADRGLLIYITSILFILSVFIPYLQEISILGWTVELTNYIGWSGFLYAFYFLLGGLLEKIEKKWIRKVYVIISLCFINVITFILLFLGYPLGFHRVFETLWMMSGFLLVKSTCINMIYNSDSKIAKIASCTFGIYCIHVLLSLLCRLSFNDWMSEMIDNIWISDAIRYILVTTVSFGLVYLLKKVPIVRKLF